MKISRILSLTFLMLFIASAINAQTVNEVPDCLTPTPTDLDNLCDECNEGFILETDQKACLTCPKTIANCDACAGTTQTEATCTTCADTFILLTD